MYRGLIHRWEILLLIVLTVCNLVVSMVCRRFSSPGSPRGPASGFAKRGLKEVLDLTVDATEFVVRPTAQSFIKLGRHA